ncbi:DUF6094 domain-containing protein [Weissella muntiaci]|nr:DUF6094 domain-containing protein [Weissella muntiaci]
MRINNGSGRIGNQLMMGYYATPEFGVGDVLVNKLLNWGDPSDENFYHRLFDPTAGKGKILAYIVNNSKNVNVELMDTFGVELDAYRASEAKSVLNHVLHSPIEKTRLSPEMFDFVFSNPPYLADGDGNNFEYTVLDRATNVLKATGIHVFIDRWDRFTLPKFQNHFLSLYEDGMLMRFNDEQFEDFEQVIFIGKKRRSQTVIDPKYQDNDVLLRKQFSKLNELGSTRFGDIHQMVKEYLPTIGDINHEWTVPFSKQGKYTFSSVVDYPEDYQGVGNSAPLQSLFERFVESSKPLDQSNPLNRPKSLINSGQIGVMIMSGLAKGSFGEGSTFHLAQGSESVSTSTRSEISSDNEGRVSSIKEIETTSRQASFVIATKAFGFRRLYNKMPEPERNVDEIEE